MSYGSVDGLETEAQLAHIEDSLILQRLQRQVNNNSTGDCEDCEAPIPEARLAIVPNAACCVHCQAIRDKPTNQRFTFRNPYMP